MTAFDRSHLFTVDCGPNRKKQCILIVIVLVIIGVILVIVFADSNKK